MFVARLDTISYQQLWGERICILDNGNESMFFIFFYFPLLFQGRKEIFVFCNILSVQFSSVQSLSRVQLFATPWTRAQQASLSNIL